MTRADDAFAALRDAQSHPDQVLPGPCQWCLGLADATGFNPCTRCRGTGRVPGPSITNKPWLWDGHRELSGAEARTRYETLKAAGAL